VIAIINIYKIIRGEWGRGKVGVCMAVNGNVVTRLGWPRFVTAAENKERSSQGHFSQSAGF